MTETEGIANARSTLHLVLSAGLRLAGRVIDHVDLYDVTHAQIDDTLDAGGYMWAISAQYRDGSPFVGIRGEPQRTGGNAPILTSVEELVAVMHGNSASFQCNVPRTWVGMALRESERIAEGLDRPVRLGDVIDVLGAHSHEIFDCGVSMADVLRREFDVAASA